MKPATAWLTEWASAAALDGQAIRLSVASYCIMATIPGCTAAARAAVCGGLPRLLIVASIDAKAALAMEAAAVYACAAAATLSVVVETAGIVVVAPPTACVEPHPARRIAITASATARRVR